MTLITLSEFQRVSGLSDSVIIWLLKNQMLKIELDPDKGILLDTDALEIQEVINAIATRKESHFQRKRRVMIEKITSLIGDNLEEITRAAITKSLEKSNVS